MGNYWKDFGNLETAIEDVQLLMRQKLKQGVSREMDDIFDHLLASEGKCLRAGITILSGRVCGGRDEELIPAAAAFEMLHLATLVHDDIIDDSDLRRGRASVQSLFGKDAAVYTGDYILARAFRLIAQKHLEFLAPLSRGIERICMGEINQNRNRYNSALSSREYFRIISGKTAALFYMCSRAGARIAGGGIKQQKNLAGAAGYMGMAFQILDDCRDYEADRKKLGKDPVSDIENGVYTLPLIMALKNGEIPDFQQLSNAGRIEEIAEAVKKSRGLKQAYKAAYKFEKKAHARMEELETNEAHRQLMHLYSRMMEV